ncbi:four helix bundle protein [Panacibacter ginsenosidivorans]|uniref:Four helix bundle protein n=1 Tax=Panacibacter ginsenosidivorans TaxID=1813871 RepID=A0A5B8VHL3_9BACT|nr:four helix bundle protein [Panacibacter ginsenosidivorans]
MWQRSHQLTLRIYLSIKCGSISELEYQVLLAKELSYLSAALFEELTDEIIEIRKMICSFIQKIEIIIPHC